MVDLFCQKNVKLNKKYLIYTYDYDGRIGGIVLLHYLCHLINSLGYEAYLYKRSLYSVICEAIQSSIVLIKNKNKSIASGYNVYINFKKTLDKRNIKQNVKFYTPFYSGKINNDFIVVYPEVVDGNPYNGFNIVRWFLHKPGYHTGRINYGLNELYFYIHDHFNDTSINKFSYRLFLVYLDFSINKGGDAVLREVDAYCVRKGSITKPYHSNDAILIDNLQFDEVITILKKTRRFISYDTQTFFSTLAVLCGAESIVIPERGIFKNQWVSDESLTYGIAYGLDDIEWARATKHKVFEKYNKIHQDSINSVNDFIEVSQGYFID